MSENRDPIECPSCETVNAWNAETCRNCGNILKRGQPEESETASHELHDETDDRAPREPEQVEQVSAAPERRSIGPFGRRRWNVFWIMLGIGIHVVCIHFGVFAVIKYLIEPDPELKARLEQAIASSQLSENTTEMDISEGASDGLKSKLSTIRVLVITLLVLVPIGIGLVIGFFTGNVLEGAASMGLSAVLIPLLNNAAVYAVFWGPVNSGLGALGAFMGYRLGVRVKKV